MFSPIEQHQKGPNTIGLLLGCIYSLKLYSFYLAERTNSIKGKNKYLAIESYANKYVFFKQKVAVTLYLCSFYSRFRQ